MVSPLLQAALASILPISELRGGIAIALAQGVNPVLAYIVCVAANILVAPIAFLFLESMHHRLLPLKFYRRTFDYFLERTRGRAQKKIAKWGYVGLFLLVAVPLPMTGAYTGALAAWFFGMKKGKSIAAITLGVAIAGIIVTASLVAGLTALTALGLF